MRLLNLFLILLILSLAAFTDVPQNQIEPNKPYLKILGVAQDAGYPQAGCFKPHCMKGWKDKSKRLTAISIAYITESNKSYMFDASPDFPHHLYDIYQDTGQKNVDGIFITHAHIGHYTGLMYLGHEAMGAKNTPVYVMPRMKSYLEQNGPWSQLVTKNNINLHQMTNEQPVPLSDGLKVTPILVPHRDEFSETVGYHIQGPNKSALFIPDINKWNIWEKDIREEIKKVNYALIDATFYSGAELPGRDMSKIPHPSVEESMDLFKGMSAKDKKRVWFIHMNHSNPLLDPNSKETKTVLKNGYNIAREGMKLPM